MGTEYYVKYNNIFVMIPKIQKKKKKNVVTQVGQQLLAKSIWHPLGSVSKCHTLLTEMIGSILSINKDLLHSPNLFYYFYTITNVLKAKHQVRQKNNWTNWQLVKISCTRIEQSNISADWLERNTSKLPFRSSYFQPFNSDITFL